jgi:hypothetical protein
VYNFRKEKGNTLTKREVIKTSFCVYLRMKLHRYTEASFIQTLWSRIMDMEAWKTVINPKRTLHQELVVLVCTVSFYIVG